MSIEKTTYWARANDWVYQVTDGVTRGCFDDGHEAMMFGGGWAQIPPPPLLMGAPIYHKIWGLGYISGIWTNDHGQPNYLYKSANRGSTELRLSDCYLVCS